MEKIGHLQKKLQSSRAKIKKGEESRSKIKNIPDMV